MNHLLLNKIFNGTEIFDNRFIEVKSLYLSLFNVLPNVNYLGHIDGERAYKAFAAQYAAMVLHTNTYRWYEQRKKKYRFDRTVVILNNNFVLEFNDDYIDVLHDGSGDAFLKEITAMALRFKERTGRRKPEVNLIVKGYEGLELKPMEIKRTKLDLDLYYEDGFREVDEAICKRLNKKQDKGIVLLHGLPGTGKTTYLRYLIGRVKKRVLFLSPDVAGSLMDPSFIQLLIDNPDSILIIEDAENIIMDRRSNQTSSVSNLLNISDGLLADFLNVQLVCTFNNALTLIDSALMRKGRLIAKYEFGKLSPEKAQRLSDQLGLKQVISEPMTIAEIANPKERHEQPPQVQMIGFRRTIEEIVS
jgi:energy-coupling factor transporter ATP-binding protein EcfA2